MLLKKVRVQSPGDKFGMRQDGTEQVDVRCYAEDDVAIQRPEHLVQRLTPRLAMRDEFGEHGIVMHCDLRAFGDAAVDPQPAARWRDVAQDRTDRRQKTARGVLGVDAALDGVTVLPQVFLRERQRLTGGDENLRPYQILPGDHLGHGMLDLKSRVDLQKVECAIRIENELDRAGVGVADGLGGADGGIGHLCPKRQRQRR